MAVTPKQNWRYPKKEWEQFAAKMHRLGTERSAVLTQFVDGILAESDDETRRRLGLEVNA